MKKLSTSTSKILALILVLLSLCACHGGPAEEPTSAAPQSITITVDVVDDKGETSTFEIDTDCDTLRGALEQEKLISGTQGAYGLYVKVVNGLTADYDIDQSYWAFYKDGEFLSTGVDSTYISDGEHYEIVYTK